MSTFRMFLLAILILPLMGCYGKLLLHSEEYDGSLIAAAPLCEEVPVWIVQQDGRCKGVPSPPTAEEVKSNPIKNKEYIAGIVNESQFLCGRFVNELVLSSIGIHSDLDIATTVLSALGTALTPIATVHALTAASSITSGWKTALDSDLYAQATIGNYAQIIQTTYYSDINSYVKQLEKISDDQLVPAIELTKIRPIHKECSLASAQAAIHASLQPSNAPTSDTTVTITIKTVTAKDTFGLVGTSDTPKLTITTALVTAANADKPQDVATRLYAALLSAPGFLTAGIAATLDSNSIKLNGGSSFSWKAAGTGNMSVSGGAGTADTSPTGTSPKSSSATTTSVTPGHGAR